VIDIPRGKDRINKGYRCGVCGVQGHSKRTCPKVTGKPLVETREKSRRGPRL
jgi:hypothetical protein